MKTLNCAGVADLLPWVLREIVKAENLFVFQHPFSPYLFIYRTHTLPYFSWVAALRMSNIEGFGNIGHFQQVRQKLLFTQRRGEIDTGLFWYRQVNKRIGATLIKSVTRLTKVYLMCFPPRQILEILFD